MGPSNVTIVRVLTVAALTLAGLYLLGWLLWQVRIVIAFIATAAVLSLIGRPVTNFLQDPPRLRLRMPRTVAVLLTIAAFYGLAAAFFAIFIPLIADQAGIFRAIDPEEVAASLEDPLADLDTRLQSLGFAQGAMMDSFQDTFREWTTGWIEDFGESFSNAAVFVGNAFVALFSVTFMLFFLLYDRTLFSRIVLALMPDRYTGETRDVLQSSKRLLRRYLGGLVIQLTLFFGVSSTGMAIVGVEYALLIGFFAALMNIVPYLGPFLGGAFGVFVAVTTNLDMDFYAQMVPLLLKVILVFWIAQMLDNYLFQPYIFSNVIRAHPLEIFLVVLTAGYLGGVVWMILAIPGYTLLRILAREFLSSFKVVRMLTGGLEEEN